MRLLEFKLAILSSDYNDHKKDIIINYLLFKSYYVVLPLTPVLEMNKVFARKTFFFEGF